MSTGLWKFYIFLIQWNETEENKKILLHNLYFLNFNAIGIKSCRV